MAHRRMIHRTISISTQVNSLSEFAQLLFTWTVPFLDDFGKISGDPAVIKAQVMPMNSRPVTDFEQAINEMVSIGLIERYKVNEIKVIRYLKFEDHQTGLNKRTLSKFPENLIISENSSEIQKKSYPTEPNIMEKNLKEDKLNEEKLIKANINNTKNIASKYTFLDPKKFIASNEGETAALEAYRQLEPNNPYAFNTTYYYAYKKGLPANRFYEFVSEILQDRNIKNPGAVFKKKVEEELSK